MKHIQPDPVYGGYKFLTREGEPMEKLLLKCKILLSYDMGPGALRILDPYVVLANVLRLCSHWSSEGGF